MNWNLSRAEAAVVVVVLAFAGALLPPSLLHAHASSRRGQCINNLKGVGLAAMAWATRHGGALPYLSGVVHDADPDDGRDLAAGDVFLTVSRAGEPVERIPAGWPVTIMPEYDQTALFEALQDAVVGGNGTASSDLRMLVHTNVPGFTCPDDATADRGGSISYVANAGVVPESAWRGRRAVSLIGTGWRGARSFEDRVRVSLAAGVFVRPGVAAYARGGPRLFDRRQTLDAVSRGDGVTRTLMFSENLAAGLWWRPRLGDVGFAWAASDDRRFVRPASRPGGFGDERGPLAAGRFRPNVPWRPGGTAAEGAAPRPSSNHPDGAVLCVFCDGHAEPLSPRIDPSVYVRLVTPRGEAFGEEPLHAGDF